MPIEIENMVNDGSFVIAVAILGIQNDAFRGFYGRLRKTNWR